MAFTLVGGWGTVGRTPKPSTADKRVDMCVMDDMSWAALRS